MKFKSPTEQPLYIGLTTGHTCVVGPEYVDVDVRFQREAVAAGAIPFGMEAEPPAQPPETTQHELIKEAIRKLVAKADTADFANDGKPKAPSVSALVGFTVTSAARDAAWAEIADEG